MIFPNEELGRAACESVGINFKQFPHDGVFHVVDTTEGKPRNGAGRIKFFEDGKGGIAWNWQTGKKQNFSLNKANCEPTPPAELERIKKEQRKRQMELQKRQDRAAKRAVALWGQLIPAEQNHPVCILKCIKPHCARVGDWRRTIQNNEEKYEKLIIKNSLIIPMFDQTGALRSLQAIFPEIQPALGRNKDFLPGSGLAGLFCWLGKKTDKVLVCEGFATACTLHEQTNYRVYVAFSANNLMSVGLIIREKLPDVEIVFCGDNDAKTLGNPGITKATEAAAAVDGYVIAPPIPGDFNDYHVFLMGLQND
ncbi:MAG: toprim domain-containing protein [Methylococcaceae bacterium]